MRSEDRKLHELARHLWHLGCRDIARGIEIGRKAIAAGDEPASIAEQIARNVSDMFGRKRFDAWLGRF